MADEDLRRRATDRWFEPLTILWDWIDKRDIDKHIVAGLVLWMTFKITDWAMHLAMNHPEKTGLEIAAIIGAIMVPWSALQAAAIKFFFEARSTP